MKRLPALIGALAATTALGNAPAPDAETVVAASLEPKKVHEACMRLEAGQTRRYHWKSSSPVDFNIHYHRGNEVFYPVKRDAMRGDGGTFTAKSAEDYCWMWAARDKPAKVDGQIR